MVDIKQLNLQAEIEHELSNWVINHLMEKYQLSYDQCLQVLKKAIDELIWERTPLRSER